MAHSDAQNFSARNLLREPTVHFFLIAVLIFGLNALVNQSNQNTLEIDQREIDARIFMQEMASGEPLTEQQREFVTSSYIEEQILVQEALAMGLDNDARIHDLLAQKMLHVLSGDVIQPTDTELQTYYQQNLERYRSLPAISVMELVVDNRGPLPDAALELLQAGAEASTILERVEGNSDPLPNVNRLDLNNIFSAEFSDQVFSARVGQWVGPYTSNRGQHWLQILEIIPSRLSPLDEISDRVRLEWINAEEEARLNEQITSLWEKYSVVITDDSGSHE